MTAATHPKTTRRAPARLKATAAATFLALGALTLAAPAQAQSVTHSALYYRIGGGSPGGAANYRGQLSNRLGLGGTMRLNYSCGKFDVGLSWQNLMNAFSSLGTTVTSAVQAGIASLPLYILQRAQPGLYQLFQNYSAKADVLVASSLKTCEETEAQIKAGQDPYEKWVQLAQGESWKEKADALGDIVQAKIDIGKNESAQRYGVQWVMGERAGGVGQKPVKPTHDVTVAGYNATLNRPASTSETTNYSAVAAVKNTRMVRAFESPQKMADWATSVLGDKEIYLCNQTDCPQPTTTQTATGLGPKYEAEYDLVQPVLSALAEAPAGASVPNLYDELQKTAAPGMAVTPQLMDSVRRLPAQTRSIVVNRLSEEMAMQRVVNQALIVRSAMLTGLSLPEVTKAGDAIKDTQETIDRLTHYIDDLMYEAKVRKQLTSNTALAVMEEQAVLESASASVSRGTSPDPAPLENGRVRTTP